MAEKIVSPGVFTREQDFSFVPQGIADIGAAIVGPTVKGPGNVPIEVNSFSEYELLFGTSFASGSQSYEYLTSLAAEQYLKHSGTLTVVRAMAGSFTGASADAFKSGSTTLKSFVLKTIGDGTVMNNSGSETDGILVSGSANDVRFQVTTVNEAKGTFTLLIRRGDDSAAKRNVLETWNNISLDPNSQNYIGKTIGTQYATYDSTEKYVKYLGSYPNKSKFVYVEESTIADTIDWYDADGGVRVSTATGSLPKPSSGSFSGGTNGTEATGKKKMYGDITSTNIQGIAPAAYVTGIELLSNADEYDINMIACPGINAKDHGTSVTKLMQVCEERGDCFAIVDPAPFGAAITDVTAEAEAENNSYAAMYWPWVQIPASRVGKNVWVPASVVMPGVLSFNDAVAAEWYAPAGLNRGGIASAIRAERKLSHANRDTLYESRVNPLATFPGEGVVVWGQKTLQKRSTALDRVNVRRLLINLKKFIASTSKYLVFENNTDATRQRFLSAVNPYMESVQQNNGLYAFKVIMDSTNNTADVIDRNIMKGDIYIQPAKAAEFIVVDFNIMPTGATFGE